MTLDELTDHFVKNQSYLETGAPKLAKQFNTTVEHINNAKHYAKRKLIEKLQDEIAIGEVLPPYRQETISLKDFARSIGIDMDEDIEMMDEVKSSDEWEEKVKWVKTKDESKLFVKKKSVVVSDETDFKKEFTDFLENAFKEKVFNWNYQDKLYETNPEMCLVLCLFDVHIGRESYKHYTDDITNLQTQQDEFVKAINTLTESLPYDKLEKIILPIGNDFFNIDTPQGTTTRGTPQDNTKDLHSMFYTGLNLLTEVSVYLSSLAPVELILIPGNHDTVTSSYLATALKMIFKDNLRVSVDDSPISRKYRQYGQTTIGFAHGELKMEKYAELLPYEAKEMFATSKWYEYLLGDKHHEKMIQKEDGVVVRHLGGMTKADVWTYTNGYTTSKRRAYGIVYHKEQGRLLELIHQL